MYDWLDIASAKNTREKSPAIKQTMLKVGLSIIMEGVVGSFIESVQKQLQGRCKALGNAKRGFCLNGEIADSCQC